jgi:hypothetical protein
VPLDRSRLVDENVAVVHGGAIDVLPSVGVCCVDWSSATRPSSPLRSPLCSNIPLSPALESFDATRERLVRHYAYVVENIEATVERLVEQLGAGPFSLVENARLVDTP